MYSNQLLTFERIPMKNKFIAPLALAGLTMALPLFASQPPALSGDYLEVRSCDIYTGSCVANAEMNLAGKEGILVWSVREGSWRGVNLDGLTVIAVVRTDKTMGDVQFQPRQGQAVLIVDAKATVQQREALTEFARTMADKVVGKVVEIKTSPIDVEFNGKCSSGSCATVKAGNLVQVTTRCLGGKDHLCGNEETYYPPLTTLHHSAPAFTELASYTGNGLNMTWEITGTRSAFLGSFEQ